MPRRASAAARHRTSGAPPIAPRQPLPHETGADSPHLVKAVPDDVHRTTEERLRVLLRSLPNAVLVIDQAGTILSADGRVLEIFGYDGDALVGASVDLLVPEAMQAAHPGHRRSYTDSPRPRHMGGSDVAARRRDGTEVAVEITLNPIVLGGRPLVMATVTDVAEARAHRQELEQREHELEEAQRVARLGSWTLDPASGKATWSREMYRILGLDPNDRPVDLPDITALFKADSVERVTAAIGRAIENAEPWRLDLELVGPPGPRGWVESIGSAERDASGRIRRIRGTMQDVTAQRDLEARLDQAHRLETLGQLAGGIAHDFNNLLTAIRGYAELVAQDLEDPDARSHADIAQILQTSDRAAGLVRQLMAFARRQVLAPEVLDPDAVIDALVPMLRRLLGEHIEITTLLQSGPARIKVDPGQLEQVIVNLAVNARDAMVDGGPLTIETRVVDLDRPYASEHLGDVTPGPHVLLAVTDAGRGIEPGVQARIFEPFFTTKEQGKGTGMGLATVFGIVRQSGGSIYVYSEPGQGTTFKLYLPVASGSIPERAAEVAVETERPLEPRTILIVEDDAAVRGFTRRALEAAGHRVLDAEGGAAALAVSHAHRGTIDLLVTDAVMPAMPGHELAGRLLAERPDLRVLYVSGFTESTVIHHGIRAPGVAFLPKPYNRREVTDAVARLITASR